MSLRNELAAGMLVGDYASSHDDRGDEARIEIWI